MRGVYEHPPGSKVWWIHYHVDGKRHREKVGRKGDAIKLYAERKADALRGRKLPDLVKTKNGKVTLSTLIDDVLVHVAHHRDLRGYQGKAQIIRPAIGHLVASEITPQVLLAYLNEHTKTPATFNRYRAFLSLSFKVGILNSKVTSNPARGFSQRKESAGRKRYLSREEYARVCASIRKLSPEHLPEFIVSVQTGMRLSEQYTFTWRQVDLDQRKIELVKTKNGSDRTVRLTAEAVAALQELAAQPHKPGDRVFRSAHANHTTRDWFKPALADARITEYKWHGNRHTYCSWLSMSGASLKDIQELAGHKAIAMSARYAHLSPDHLMSVVDRSFNSQRTTENA
jgi:integrase